MYQRPELRPPGYAGPTYPHGRATGVLSTCFYTCAAAKSTEVYVQQHLPDRRRPAHPAKPPSNRPPAPKDAPQVSRPAKSTVPAQSSTHKVQLAMTDEQFLQGLMTADLRDVESQLELLLQGRTATDHIPKGLSTLSQFLLYRQQVLDNPHPEQWIMANWQAVRTMAGRLSLIRKYQRPFAFLKEPDRQRCARYLLSLFPDPVPCESIGNSEFFWFC